MEKTFESISELIKDPNFIQYVSEGVKEIRKERIDRPEPRPGYHYKRDWYDRILDLKSDNQTLSDFFLQNIEAIWCKKSSLGRDIRFIIQNVCDIAVYKTNDFYAAIKDDAKPKKKPTKRIKVVVD